MMKKMLLFLLMLIKHVHTRTINFDSFSQIISWVFLAETSISVIMSLYFWKRNPKFSIIFLVSQPC